MNMYKMDQANPLGKGHHLPAGSLLDKDLLSLLMRYRRTVAGNYKSVLIEELEERIEEGAMLISPKIDGELWFMIIDEGEAVLSNTRGRMIVGDVPLLAEAQKVVGRCHPRTVIAGELFAAKAADAGRPRVGDVANVMGGGAQAEVKRLGFAAFDLVLGGDDQAAMPMEEYNDKYGVLERIFKDGKRIKPAPLFRINTRKEISDYYTEWVESRKFEGIVIRTRTRTIKLKPSFTIDAVVIGYTQREEDPSLLRSMALALMRPDGTLQYIANCGNMSEETRRQMLKLLQGREVDSNWRLSSSGGALYRFIRPEIVVEIKATDVQAEDSTGQKIRTMTLSYDKNKGLDAIRKQPAAALLFPVFVRVRDDKQVNETDIRIGQVLERTLVENTEAKTEKVDLPRSEVLRREVYQKTAKNGTAVRKLVMWKTNKESIDTRYPAFVVHWTDYSPGRKDPLKREVRLAPTREIADNIATEMLADNIKKGWQLTE